jgi:hypothetical protein
LRKFTSWWQACGDPIPLISDYKKIMTKISIDINDLFLKFIYDFIKKDKQDRLIQFLNKEKNWHKIENEFHTSLCFDTKKLIEIKPSEQYADIIYLRMKELGATENCFSLLDYLNEKEYVLDLKTKLANSVGFLIETILYCPTKKVGYFEGGHAKDRYILKSIE